MSPPDHLTMDVYPPLGIGQLPMSIHLPHTRQPTQVFIHQATLSRSNNYYYKYSQMRTISIFILPYLR